MTGAVTLSPKASGHRNPKKGLTVANGDKRAVRSGCSGALVMVMVMRDRVLGAACSYLGCLSGPSVAPLIASVTQGQGRGR